jgi:hypothetical protein
MKIGQLLGLCTLVLAAVAAPSTIKRSDIGTVVTFRDKTYH